MHRFPDFLGLQPFFSDGLWELFFAQTLGVWIVAAQRRGDSGWKWLWPVQGRWRGYLGWLLILSSALLVGYLCLTEPVDPDVGSADDAPLWLEVAFWLVFQLCSLLVSVLLVAAGFVMQWLARRAITLCWRPRMED